MSDCGDDSRQDDDFQTFVKVVENEDSDDIVELPCENNDTILISTLQGQYPNAVGLRYKSSSGGWRGVRISEDTLNPPHGGWGDTVYHVTLCKDSGIKRKIDDIPKMNQEEVTPKKTKPENEKSENSLDIRPAERRFLADMIVLSLPPGCKDSDLKEYFTNACGEMALHEVKYDRQTKRPRGFGFIRFRTVDGAKAALNGEHSIMGKKVEIRLSKKKDDPMKLFVGRIPDGTSAEELKNYFTDFGEVQDAYIPTPFRGFGFVTYISSEDGRAVLRRNHQISGVKLNVQFAEPKEEKMARRKQEEQSYQRDSRGGSTYGQDSYEMDSRNSRDVWNGRNNDWNHKDSRDRYNEYDSRGGDHRGQYGGGDHHNQYGGGDHRNLYGGVDPRDAASELKNMIFNLLSGSAR